MKKIIFFDGLCPLCHFWVQYILKRDRNDQFLFAPLQGKTARELLPPKFLSLDTIVLLENKKEIYIKAKAIFKIIKILGGVRKILLIFIFVPNFIKNYIYDLIAKHRFKIWKPLENCPIPRKKVAIKFLD